MATGLDSSILHNPDVTPEKKLALLKITASELDRDVFSEPDISGHTNGLFNSHARSSSARGAARSSTRQMSSSRRTSSFISSHRNKMSMELTTQAESKFFALMEFMASASREASSLKEYWSKLMGERESWAREREELLVRIDQVSETLEQKEKLHGHHGHEIGERKREVERLLLELSTALTDVSAHKKRVTERDQELDAVRQEIQALRVDLSRSQGDHEKVRVDFESIELRLRTAENERDHARGEAEKHRGELRALTREHTELKSKNFDINTRFESSRKEVTSLLDRIRAWEREREDYLHDKDRLQEEVRKANHRADEAAKEITDLTERFDRLQRDANKSRETIRIVELERDEHHTTIEHLRHELRTKSTSIEDAEARYADIVLKYEKSKRDHTTAEDRLRAIEFEINELRSSVERKSEEYRVILIERDQHRDDLDDERRKHHDKDRELQNLREILTRTETSLSDLRSEYHTHIERIKVIERERDDAHGKHGPLHTEIKELKERVALLLAEIQTLTAHRDRAHKDLNDFKRKYEEVTETITEYNNDSGELEYEIESLRSMLREAREQKERAISARNAADRERDEALTKYEEKCREFERADESRSSFYHAHSSGSGGGRMSSTRTVTRSSGAHESSGHGYSNLNTIDGE